MLKEAGPSTMKDLDLDCIYVYGKYATRSSVSNMYSKSYLAFCSLLLDPFPLTGLPCLVSIEDTLNLTAN